MRDFFLFFNGETNNLHVSLIYHPLHNPKPYINLTEMYKTFFFQVKFF